jgi:hypothetical protein
VNYLLLADADSAATSGLITGLAGIMGLVWLAFAVYAIMAFFVPIYIYKTMRRSTQILKVLQQIRACLSYPAGPTLPFQPKSTDAARVDKLGTLVKKNSDPNGKAVWDGKGWVKG